MSSCPHRLLVITASLGVIKSPYPTREQIPDRIVQCLIALLAGLGVPFVTTENQEWAEETVTSYFYQVHLYQWLEANDYGCTRRSKNRPRDAA